jgi:hypothetical protein
LDAGGPREMGGQPQTLRDDLVQPASVTTIACSLRSARRFTSSPDADRSPAPVPSSSRILTCVSDPALKEWAVIVHALLEGEQIVDVRKGGLREDGRHFALQSSRCYLYPTAEHQKPELLKAAYRRWIDLAPAAPVGEAITIPGWVEVVESVTVTEPERLAAIESKLIWTGDYVEGRLKWKSRDPLWVLVLRAHRFDEPLTVAWDAAYGGCTSWVELAGLPADPTSVPSTPALSDVAFDARKKGIDDGLSAPA